LIPWFIWKKRIVESNRYSKITRKLEGAFTMNTLIPLFTFLPLIILAFVVRWVYQIKKNNEIQVEQNRQIISLLQNKDISN
jgi:hypothetical protein